MDNFWKIMAIFYGLIMVFAIINLVLTSNILNECEVKLEQSYYPEVIGNNLYIGYEDGKRIGYHYFNNSFYRNGIKLDDALGELDA